MKNQPPSVVTATEASLWMELRERAVAAAQAEPALLPLLERYVLGRRDFGEGLARRVAERLADSPSEAGSLARVFDEVVARDTLVVQQARGDIRAILERDPAAEHALMPFLWFKGFHAITCHRFAHSLWKAGRREMAFHIQSLASAALAVDIHPAATFGTGILLDHATGFVAGETAVVDDNVSFLHEVTLGGTGKTRGDRHPKIRSGVLVGAGAKILGNIVVGVGAKIGAGSVVLTDVPAHATAAGVPAVVVGQSRQDAPALDMDHTI
ncbi:MAG: serine O-acetyltransferase [Opitutia bacterium]|jgi:serine O-acetyltransferase